MDDYSVHINYSPCLHRHIVPVTTGNMHFSEGEVSDNIHEFLLCIDCMEYLTEEEVRLAGMALILQVPLRSISNQTSDTQFGERSPIAPRFCAPSMGVD